MNTTSLLLVAEDDFRFLLCIDCIGCLVRQARQGPGQEKSFIFVSPEQWFCGPYFVHSDFTKTWTLRLQIVSRPFLLCHKGKWQKEISVITKFEI